MGVLRPIGKILTFSIKKHLFKKEFRLHHFFGKYSFKKLDSFLESFKKSGVEVWPEAVDDEEGVDGDEAGPKYPQVRHRGHIGWEGTEQDFTKK